jgi:hypothetical protein
MIDIERAREALEKLLELPTINSAARYYARLAMSYLADGAKTNDQYAEEARTGNHNERR